MKRDVFKRKRVRNQFNVKVIRPVSRFSFTLASTGCDLPCILGYLISTLSANLIVELVVSVPARYRFKTVDTKLS